MQKAWGIRKGFLESRTRDVNEKEKNTKHGESKPRVPEKDLGKL